MEIFLTIISATLIFIISQCVLEFILKPLLIFRDTIGRIDNKLKFYSNVIVNPPFSNNLPEDYLAAKEEIRKLSCELESNYKKLLFFKPDRRKISESAKDLIWLSNAIGHKDKNMNLPIMAAEKIDNIRKTLNILELN
jgi:hypothetical protein